jgi:pimeloyl-ACP methyl ester carboxylesterase
MPATISHVPVDGREFHVEQSGSGDPLVLIHGGWGSTARWALIVDGLAESFHVVNYDRRGHGHSQASLVPATRRDQEDDLAALIEGLDIAPARLVGNSFGASIALSLAARRPDLVRSVAAHEPPLADLAADHPAIRQARADMATSIALIHEGRREAAAIAFVETLVLGPGGWDQMPQEVQAMMVRHADTFAGEQDDPEWAAADLDGIACPVLLTAGDQSPAWFGPATAAVHEAIPHADLVTIPGAGHVPHITHPAEYVELLTRFAAG